MGGRSDDTYLDIVNVDHYDAVLGVPFLNMFGINLDFEENVIKARTMGTVQSLKVSEEIPVARKKAK